MKYFDELCAAMADCASNPAAIFVGQTVRAGGTTMAETFRDVAPERRLEFPVAEDLQVGFCTGLALEGKIPISIFPRWNFLLCAANQLVNHLDRLVLYSGGQYRPRVLIRVAVPATVPINGGPQHSDDFTDVFRAMCRTIRVVNLTAASAIRPAYALAMSANKSTILVEHTKLYKMEGNHNAERHATRL